MERVNRALKVALKAQLATENWLNILPVVLLGLRTVVRADLNATASEMVYGTQLRDFLVNFLTVQWHMSLSLKIF